MSKKARITAAHGDGIGPPIMEASLRIAGLYQKVTAARYDGKQEFTLPQGQ